MDYKLILSNGAGECTDLYSDPNIRLVSTDGIGFSAEISTTKIYGYDGSMFQGNSLQQRGISLIVRYKSTYYETQEMAKNRLMKLLGNKGEVKLRYVAPNRDVYIMCRVEQVNTSPNTKPMNTQISLICPDPYWRASGDNTVVIAGTESLWEFPCEIPPEGMEFGRIRAETIVTVINDGTAESGAVFTITAKTSCSNPKIENIDTGEFLQAAVRMEAGDVLIFGTEQGKKSISFIHDGVTQNYFNYRVSGSSFLQIRPGENRFKYTVDSGDDHAVDILCNFDVKYGGI